MARNQGLLERDAELAELADEVDRAWNGSGGAVLIEGAAGIGKTRLLGEARGLGRERGMCVLAARGAALEREFAWGLARQLFEPLLTAADDDGRKALLAGSAGLCLPMFESHQSAPPRPDSAFAIQHGLHWLAVNASDEAPLLIAADDLHWSDGPSLRFLEYLAGRLEGVPILLVGTFRPAEPGAEQPVLGAVAPGPRARRIGLDALSEEGSAALVRHRFSTSADPAFCRACHVASGGNPLLLSELVGELARAGVPPTERGARAIVELGPKAVSRTVQVRLSRATPEVSRFAAAAAVLGDGSPFGLAAKLAEIDGESAYEVIATLHRLDMLRSEPRIEFAHPLVRSAIYEDMGPGHRERAHAQAARILTEAGASPERVAAHLMRTVPANDRGAVAALRGAARRALAEGGAEAAVSYLGRALEEPPPPNERAEVLFELGAAEALIDGRGAAEHLELAVTLTDGGPEVALRADLLARVLFFAGQPEGAIDVTRRGLGELGSSHPELRRRLEATLLFAAIMDPSLNGLADSLDSAVREAGGAEDFGAKALIGTSAYRKARACVPASEVVPRAKQATEGGVLIAEDNGGGASMLAPSVLALADSELALPIYAAGLDAARRTGSVFGFLANKIFACQAHLLRGELHEAVADGKEALDGTDAYVRFDDPRGEALRRFVLPWPVSFLATAQMECGELDAAARTLGLVAGLDEPVPNTHNWHWYLDSRSRLRIARGDLGRGLEETLGCGRRFESVGGRNPALIAWRSRAALCLTELGQQPDRARELAGEELELARRWGAPRTVGAALRARGLVVGGDEGLDSLREAIAVLDPSPARLELARALVDLGAQLRRKGRRTDAREPLRRGMELAHECGAAPLVARARTELRAAGGRPRTPLRRGLDSLTPSERRVAEMGADGLTNREIAQNLFVTQKTIESHMRSIFRKLDIGSRSDLADALARGSEP